MSLFYFDNVSLPVYTCTFRDYKGGNRDIALYCSLVQRLVHLHNDK